MKIIFNCLKEQYSNYYYDNVTKTIKHQTDKTEWTIEQELDAEDIRNIQKLGYFKIDGDIYYINKYTVYDIPTSTIVYYLASTKDIDNTFQYAQKNKDKDSKRIKISKKSFWQRIF